MAQKESDIDDIKSRFRLSNKIFVNDSIVRSLINAGEINFSKSNTKKDSCRVYFIDLDLKNNFYLEIANCSETIKIIDFKLH